MRHSLVCLMAAAVLFSAGATARAEDEPIVEKIVLSFTDPDEMLRLVTGKVGTPRGVQGILAYPLDNALLVRGPSEAIEAFKATIAVGDVMFVSKTPDIYSTLLRFRNASPKQVQQARKALLKLPNAGSAVVEDNRLSLRGKHAWVAEAIAGAMLAELEASGVEIEPPSPPQVNRPEKRGGERNAAWITITVPSGANPVITSDKVDYSAPEGEALFTGLTKVKAAGAEIEVRGLVRVSGGKAGQPAVIQFMRADDAARMILPYSTEVRFEGTSLNYKSETMRLETSGAVTIRLPKGVTVEIRDGKAITALMRKGEPIELTVTPAQT